MPTPSGFAFDRRKNGDVVITHHNKVATVLRGSSAERLAAKLEAADEPTAQHLMARATGNYKRGNER